MRHAFIAVAILLVMILCPPAYGLGGCDEDCAKCHSLEQKEAEQILSRMKATDSRVSGIRMSPIRGLWEVSVESKGRNDIMYLDFSKKQVIKGTIVSVDAPGNALDRGPANRPSDTRQQKQKFVEIAKIPLENSLVLGDRNAGNKVIVFTDPDCPYCAKLHEEMKKVVAEKKDIAFYLKLMPLKMHPDAHWKARSIMCSTSMQMLEDNFEKKAIPRPQCESAVIDDNIRLGNELGITGTPTLIMADGFVLFGGKDAKALRDLILAHGRKSS